MKQMPGFSPLCGDENAGVPAMGEAPGALNALMGRHGGGARRCGEIPIGNEEE
jgi:hypothetical protein